MKKKILSMALAGVSVLAAQAALAAPVTSWMVTLNTVFDLDSVVEPGVVANAGSSQSRLVWGSGNSGPSALEIGGSNVATTVTTNGDAITNVWITHENNPIFDNTRPFLESVDILSTLSLSPDPFGGAATTLTFPVTFYETPNAANPCANGTPNNQGVNANGCADIFVIDQNTLDITFEYEGFWYGLSFFGGILAAGTTPESDVSATGLGLTPGLDVLSDEACASVAMATGNVVPSGCRGWLTPEQQTTTFLFATSIRTLDPPPVPEPATIALMGLGLGMLGMMRRRRVSV